MTTIMPRLRVLHYRSLASTAPEAHELELPGERDVTIEGHGGAVMHLATVKAQITSLTVRGLCGRRWGGPSQFGRLNESIDSEQSVV